MFSDEYLCLQKKRTELGRNVCAVSVKDLISISNLRPFKSEGLILQLKLSQQVKTITGYRRGIRLIRRTEDGNKP